MKKRIMALDLGKKRIGVAVSDELGITALGLDTIQCRNYRTDLGVIARLAAERGVDTVVIGNPLNMSGEAGPQADWVREYAERIVKFTGLQIQMWDERLTSAEASRLLREGGISVDRKTGTVDKMAAVLLLQSYLDAARYGQ